MRNAILASTLVLSIASAAAADPRQANSDADYHALISDSFVRAGLTTQPTDRAHRGADDGRHYRDVIDGSFERAGLLSVDVRLEQPDSLRR